MKTLENVIVLSLEDYEQLMKNQKPEELEVGKWYKFSDKGMFCYSGKTISYGFDYNGIWCEDLGHGSNLGEATREEVEQALIKEAENRYKVGDKAMCLAHNEELVIQNLHLTKQYPPDYNRLWYGQNRDKAVVVFKDGKWAEIIPEPEYKDGDIVISESCGSQFITEHKWGSIGNYQCHRFVSGDKKSLSHGGTYTKILRHATKEEKELFNELANPEPKVGDIVKAWDVHEELFIIGKLEELNDDFYTYIVGDTPFQKAKTLTQEQTIKLLFD